MRSRLFAVALLAVAGCASDSDVLSYDEFKAQSYQEPDTGVYVLNGQARSPGAAEGRQAQVLAARAVMGLLVLASAAIAWGIA